MLVVTDDGVARAGIQHRQVGASTTDRCQFLTERDRPGPPGLAGQTFPQRDHDRFGQGFTRASCQFSGKPISLGIFDAQRHEVDYISSGRLYKASADFQPTTSAQNLAAAAYFEQELTAFVTYDHRLLNGCRDIGLATASPGGAR